jgi:hypothetical protein
MSNLSAYFFSGTLKRRVRRAKLIKLLPFELLLFVVKLKNFRVGEVNTDLICRFILSGSSECRRMMMYFTRWNFHLIINI